ncbi:hypothetical protein [Anatilimnocola floriformis]|uniref:hypothetical protein n=1 Tax=Anatilimnocola floriformis TaxID=2948575 RepID=UPI0020C219A5|nr:hypothetical protein [Anatilimnocola floriformis]
MSLPKKKSASKKAAPKLKSRNFRPTCESLESRLNLAGNVLAYALGPNLYIYGDNLSNEVRIEGVVAGTVEVTGVGTSVNGIANGQIVPKGIQNIFMEMGNGDDSATFVLTNITGMLRFNGSNGNDSLTFGEDNGDSNSFGSVAATMGAGNDAINVDDGSFTARQSFVALNGDGNNVTDLDPTVSLTLGLVSITGGSGSDFIDLGDTLVNTGYITVNSGDGDNDFFIDGNTTINGGITVIGGSGPDNFEPGDFGFNPQLTVNGSIVASLGNGTNFIEFASDNVDVTGLISVTGGSGIDTFDFDTLTFDVYAISLSLGAGDNEVLMNEGATTIRSSLTIATLGGADEITGFGLNVFGGVVVSTGEGDDLIQLDNSRFRSVVTVSTAGGNDRVNVENGNQNDGIGTQFDSIVSMDLGAGSDTLDIGVDANDFVRFNSRVIVNGGLGTDTLLPSAFNVFALAPTLISFP